MNLLKHHIKEIHSISDITDRFIKSCGYEPNEALLEVDLTYDCYVVIKRKKETFWKSNFEEARKCGYFMG